MTSTIPIDLVFVHYGTKIPKHLSANIHRTAGLFPNSRIVLLTDQTQGVLPKNCLSYDILSNTEILETKSKLDHPINFRNGFWATTFLRLVAVAKFAAENVNPVLHIESDVILSSDFPLGKFLNLKESMAFPIVGPGLSVASIFYLGSRDSAAELISFLKLELEADPTTTDMKVLDRFRLANPGLVALLPIGPENQSAYLSTLSPSDFTKMQALSGYFGGVFDAIDVGFYLFGEDPRNNRGFRLVGKIDTSSYLKINQLLFSISDSRNFIDMSFNNLCIPIYSVHIHSKDLRLFNTKKFNKFLRRGILLQNRLPREEFDLGVFLKLTIQYIRQRLKLI